MRWCYKTVHYEMKKEGILGSVFLDEAEVEQSLNEYGQAGWELVSVMETQDGIIAFFKQMLDIPSEKRVVPGKQKSIFETLDIDEVVDEVTPEDLITEEDIIEEVLEKHSEIDDEGIHSIRIE